MLDNLPDQLAHLRKTCPPANLPARRIGLLRDALEASWADIRARHRNGASGREITRALTERADALIRILYDEALADAQACSPDGYALLALGGYGRGALNPRSDIDLLFLFRAVRERDPVTRALIHTLWDLRFDVGHATRTVSDCIAAAREDDESLTALLEARLLAGDPAMADRLKAALTAGFFGRKARAFVARQIQKRRERHIRAGLSVQLLEPNVKESPGGLRDTHVVGWLLRVRRNRQAPEGLLKERLLTRRNYERYTDALDFLLRTRNELHFAVGKPFDVLEHDLQPAIAAGLGYADRGQELAVERFMRDYYLHARSIKHLSDLICERLNGGASMAKRAVGFIARRTLDDGAVLTHNHIGLPKKRRAFFTDDPYRLLGLFLDAQRFGVPVNEPAQRAVVDHLHLIDDGFRHSPKAARIFLDILRAPQGVAATLHTMHELGVLGAYIPEFASIDCLVQYNRYHIYTADEHTLVAIEALERLAMDSSAGSALDPIRKVSVEIPRKDLLYLAVLMHDVGKSARGEDHSAVGARMARAFLSRLGLPQEQIGTVVFLVQNHLTMSHISQRRDLSDTAMLAEFARQFKHPDHLRMLYLLTYADLSSVTRTAWTAWKGQLLWELYAKTFNILTGGKKPPKEREQYRDAARSLIDALADRFGRHALEEHLNNLPPRYAGLNSPQEVAVHLGLIERLGAPPVALAVSQGNLYSELTVCTRDKPFRLSEICGVLATNDINIFGAQAYTRTDGVVLDVFQVTDIDGGSEVGPDRLERIERRLADVFRGDVSVDELFARHQQRWSRRRTPAYRIPTEVRFENSVSDGYTVIDIFAQDAVGLLYKITRTLSDLGLDIYTARISTQADKAVDSFYVTRAGGKVETPSELEHIRKTLTARIG